MPFSKKQRLARTLRHIEADEFAKEKFRADIEFARKPWWVQQMEEGDYHYNDFDKDQYGNTWYNVLFEGDAETFMWLKKEPPEEGKEYYGHMEPTKSGKRMRFKTDKPPESAPSSNSTSSSKKDDFKPQRDISDMPYRVWKDLLPYVDVQRFMKNGEENRAINEYVMEQANELLGMIDNVRGSGEPSVPIKEEEDSKPSLATGYDKFKKAKNNLNEAVGYSEEDVPQFDG